MTHSTWTVGDILHLVSNRNQWWRHIQALITQWVLKKTSTKWVYCVIENSIDYLQKPFFERKKIWYSHWFLATYIPNKTYFLTQNYRDKLMETASPIDLITNYYLENKKKLETILIDISFSSSSLEWNTYSYLDTEVLIKYAEISEKKWEKKPKWF